MRGALALVRGPLGGAAWLTVVCVFVAGCSGSDGGPDTLSVTGVVRLDGQPVDEATVTFSPVGEGSTAQAVTGPDGAFEMESTFDRGKTYRAGLPAGEYRVAVEKLDFESPRPPTQPPKNLLPARYESAESSGFALTVSEGGANTIDLDLNSGAGG